jgi:hypothetical protein
MMKYVIAASALLLCACGGGGEKAATSEEAAQEARSSNTLAEIAGVAENNDSATAAAPGQPPPPPIGTGTLQYPNDTQMVMLGYRLRGVEPPVGAWAEAENSVRYADEFSRAAKLQTATDTLQNIYADTDGVGFLQLRTNSQLSEYDPTRQGFYVSTFSPGSSFQFNSRETVQLQIENALAAHLWAMPTEEGAATYQRNNRSRSVVIDMTLQIVGVEFRGNRTLIKARVQSYSVHGQYSSIGQLGMVTVPE